MIQCERHILNKIKLFLKDNNMLYGKQLSECSQHRVTGTESQRHGQDT